MDSELEQTKRQVDELQSQCVLMEGQHRAENEIILAQHKDEVQAGHGMHFLKSSNKKRLLENWPIFFKQSFVRLKPLSFNQQTPL